MSTKILAMYLPQFHEFEQNNKWWGKGFTEWTNLKKAKSLFRGHRQPRVPLKQNYYNLLDKKTIYQQAELAKKYGIYGFCIYHYWFQDTQIMEKPAEILLENKDIDIKFCFSWANHTWTKAPGKKETQVLIRQTYGEKKNWIDHFKYLNKFFKDSRYIKINNKPILVIYNVVDIGCWREMSRCWYELAQKKGWNGIYYISTLKSSKDIGIAERMGLDAQFEYQPTFGTRRDGMKLDYGFWYHFKYNVLNLKIYNYVTRFRYENVWKSIMKKEYKGDMKTFLGAFNDWDTTARWGHKGNVVVGSSPYKFEKYFEIQWKKSNERSNEFLFITAWNEWSEGAYLEPDEEIGYGYLEAVGRVVGCCK